MIVIEHNLEVIKTADRIIDLGPEGGGHVVATGAPEEVAAVKDSYTGQYLKELLGRRGASGSSAAKAPAKKAAKSATKSQKRSPRKKAEAAE